MLAAGTAMANKHGASIDWAALTENGRAWTDDEAQRILAAWRDSGESLSHFAHSHGLKPNRVRWWRDRLQPPPDCSKGDVQVSDCAGGLVPVIVTGLQRGQQADVGPIVIKVGSVSIMVTEPAGVAPPSQQSGPPERSEAPSKGRRIDLE
jgi:hypothetical protein